MKDKIEKGKISVIMPVYNYGHLIGETLDSLINQTYTNWECIIVDDGSKDNTKEAIQSYIKKDKRIHYYYQTNQFTSKARNHALKYAIGEFIQFLDGDDLLLPAKFENQVKILNLNKNIDVVYSDVRFFSSENKDERLLSMDGQNKSWMPYISGYGLDILEGFIRSNPFVVNSPLLRTEVVREVGEFYNPIAKYCEDWDFWLRCAFLNKNFVYDKDTSSWALVRYHSTSSSRNLAKMIHGSIIVRKRIDKWLDQNQQIVKYKDLKILNKQIKSELYLRLLEEYRKQGKKLAILNLIASLLVTMNFSDVTRLLKRIFSARSNNIIKTVNKFIKKLK